jgi:hypothetical protein
LGPADAGANPNADRGRYAHAEDHHRADRDLLVAIARSAT